MRIRVFPAVLTSLSAIVVLGSATLLSQAAAPRGSQARATTTNPTFTEAIAPIIYANCVTCHRPGEVAPFSLITYEDAVKKGKLIAKVTESKYMPPWHATHGYGEFVGERGLTEPQIATIATWVKNGMPRGDESKMPKLPAFPPDGWRLGHPDLILEMPTGLIFLRAARTCFAISSSRRSCPRTSGCVASSFVRAQGRSFTTRCSRR